MLEDSLPAGLLLSAGGSSSSPNASKLPPLPETLAERLAVEGGRRGEGGVFADSSSRWVTSRALTRAKSPSETSPPNVAGEGGLSRRSSCVPPS